MAFPQQSFAECNNWLQQKESFFVVSDAVTINIIGRGFAALNKLSSNL